MRIIRFLLLSIGANYFLSGGNVQVVILARRKHLGEHVSPVQVHGSLPALLLQLTGGRALRQARPSPRTVHPRHHRRQRAHQPAEVPRGHHGHRAPQRDQPAERDGGAGARHLRHHRAQEGSRVYQVQFCF